MFPNADPLPVQLLPYAHARPKCQRMSLPHRNHAATFKAPYPLSTLSALTLLRMRPGWVQETRNGLLVDEHYIINASPVAVMIDPSTLGCPNHKAAPTLILGDTALWN